MPDALAERVAARYKKKKTLDTGTTVYEYSDAQVAKRNSDFSRRGAVDIDAAIGLRVSSPLPVRGSALRKHAAG